MTESEKEVGKMFWHKEPRLNHLNPEYSRQEELRKIKGELECPRLIQAYDDILKFNDQANEYNLMVDVYQTMQSVHMGGVGSDLANRDAWLKLYKKYDSDNDNLLNKAEFRTLV
jgi:hypothetical protein